MDLKRALEKSGGMDACSISVSVWNLSGDKLSGAIYR